MKLNTLRAGAAVALLAASAAVSANAATNLVHNGSFETGNFAGWTQFGDGSYTGVANSCIDFGCPSDGSHLAFFGPFDVGGIAQTLANSAGRFDISFDLSNDSGYFFSADFGGHNLMANPPSEGVTHYSFTGVHAGANAALSFSTLNPPAFYTLDNVSVTSGAPEPAAWALMLTGFLGAGATLRAKRRQRAFAAA